MYSVKKFVLERIKLPLMKRGSDDNMTVFGKQLWNLRKKRGMRQEDLAEALGVTRDTISYYESKAKNPTVEFVQKVSDFFKVPIDELLKEEDKRRRRGPQSKLERQLEMVRQLPKDKQKAISTMLDMALQSEALPTD